jgi:RimJ/RimL family protein N-acetyltransferase
MRVEPITLRGSVVRLEPLTLDHVEALARVGLEPGLWRWQPTPILTADDMRRYVVTALDQLSRGISLPFVIVEQATNQVIGCTRYMEITPEHRRLEIGYTWVASAWQRTGANTDAKLLLLTHAFETLGAIRVVLKTETTNAQSRAAIARLGATQEGVFRQHLIADSGRRRDMVYYAILDSEWPAAKEQLLGRAAAVRQSATASTPASSASRPPEGSSGRPPTRDATAGPAPSDLGSTRTSH